MKNNQYAVVTTTSASEEETERIAHMLLDQKLAACVQVLPIKSYYTWKDKLNIENENLLIIKCKRADFADIEKCIKENHSYEVPEIVMAPIEKGSKEYLDWIKAVTK
jgi:periplasmic divalent cation tolerance protein